MHRGTDSLTVAPGVELHYACERAALPESLRTRFEPLSYDADAERFVTAALANPHGAWKTALYASLRRVLSDYDAYGLLDMYAMHLLSTPQLQALLFASHAQPRSLLDVGAGRGDVAHQAAALFERVAVTEASAVMRRRLRARGLHVLDHDLAREPLPDAQRFDAILCLNVLDRCAYPRTLLRNLRAALAAGGRLVLAVPLPLRPHVQQRGRTADPEEPLPPAESTWEAGAARIAELLEREAWFIERLSRVPYVCRGDAHAPLHVLDDALFVCRAEQPADPTRLV